MRESGWNPKTLATKHPGNTLNPSQSKNDESLSGPNCCGKLLCNLHSQEQAVSVTITHQICSREETGHPKREPLAQAPLTDLRSAPKLEQNLTSRKENSAIFTHL